MRYKHGELINALLTEWLVNHNKEDLYHQGQAAGVPFAVAYSSKDLVDSEQLAERGFFTEIDHPKTGKVKYPSAPYNFSETPWQVIRPAPLLGEHNEDIFTRRLGHSCEKMAKLGAAGVI
jgi:crotonobetainyl-CoA:carnitine CoA-transferase CaiB-like acyl-CoA transferase